MNENQENNLQNSVDNSTPIEPVEMPTPVEPQAPIDEAAPVEAPTPVVEPAPVEAPTPIDEAAPVAEPTPVAEPAPAGAPAPATPVAPVEPTVAQPAETPVSPAPVETPAPKDKKGNPVLLILLIFALLAIAGYGVYTYTDIFKPKANKGGNETTTTTTTAATSNLAFKSFDEFITASKAECAKEDFYCGQDLLINLDKSFTEIDPDMDKKCTDDGQSVSFELNGNKIEYVCKKDTSEIALDDSTKTYWESDITLNGTYKYSYGTFTTSIPGELHSNGKYYIEFDNSQGVDVDHMVVYDGTQKELYKNFNVVDFIKFNKDDTDYAGIASLTKDNILYFVDVDSEPTRDVATTCNLKYIDFNKSEIKAEKTGFTSTCFVE